MSKKTMKVTYLADQLAKTVQPSSDATITDFRRDAMAVLCNSKSEKERRENINAMHFSQLAALHNTVMMFFDKTNNPSFSINAKDLVNLTKSINDLHKTFLDSRELYFDTTDTKKKKSGPVITKKVPLPAPEISKYHPQVMMGDINEKIARSLHTSS